VALDTVDLSSFHPHDRITIFGSVFFFVVDLSRTISLLGVEVKCLRYGML
jgi:hypothetical protein